MTIRRCSSFASSSRPQFSPPARTTPRSCRRSPTTANRLSLSRSAQTTRRCSRSPRITPPGSGTPKPPGPSPFFGRRTSVSSTAASAPTAAPYSRTTYERAFARLWDAPSGRFRTATEARPNRYAGAEEVIFNTRRPLTATQIGDGRLLTKSWRPDDPVVELWNTASGRLTARLDGPNRPAQQFKFLAGGRWVTATEGGSTVLMFSPEDGRVVGRLNHPAGETVNGVDASPTARWVATVSAGPKGGPETLVRLWDAGSWTEDSGQPMPVNAIGSRIGRGFDFQFWTEDLFAFSEVVGRRGHGVGRLPIRPARAASRGHRRLPAPPSRGQIGAFP